MSLESLLLDEKSDFNWVKLQRLIGHASAWQKELFDLLNRLQNGYSQETQQLPRDETENGCRTGSILRQRTWPSIHWP